MAVDHGQDGRQLLGYDEFLVHQSSGPFSQIPSTDYAWDDGTFVAMFDVRQDVHVFCGLRMNPNVGMIGGYAGIVHDGRQVTTRFKRPWGPHYEDPDLSLTVGPYRYSIVEPMKHLHLVLGKNDSGFQFDVDWRALAPPFLEPHRLFLSRGRVTTDQTRYLQVGEAQGIVVLDGTRVDLTFGNAFGTRDHSWGLYYERPPLAPRRRWLRPAESTPLAFRFWVSFGSEAASGAFQINESGSGKESTTPDVLSSPFTGHLWLKAENAERSLVAGTHELEFEPGTRLLKSGVVNLIDDEGDEWTVYLERGMEPFLGQPSGYAMGSWKDGGNIFSYPGTDETVVEFDEFNVRDQPCAQPIYGQNKIYHGIGTEYAFITKLTGPDGSVYEGQSYVELMTSGKYVRYGFTDDAPPSWLNVYHLMDE